MMATGTIAGALDESFSSDSVLELWQLPLQDAEAAPALQATATASARFNRLAWGSANAAKPRGLVAAGLENGELAIWDVQGLLNRTENALVTQNAIHKGPVRGLAFNRLHDKLLASGAVNGEIYVWDMDRPTKPFTPGARSQRIDEITSLGWNTQVSHVLATASSNGYTSVWDLRHKREVVALAYGGGAGTAGTGFGPGGAHNALASGGRRGMSAVAWHPLAATRLATASEDDGSPVIMLWDLRNSRAPEKVLTGHEKGILGLSWCQQDEDLLVACGKDNRTTVWNPQTCEMVAEMPPSANWAFDVQWCPANPNMLATASFDGRIAVQSLQSTNLDEVPEVPPETSPDDLFSTLGEQNAVPSGGMSLKHPPKWLRRPTSVAFGFGGQLVSVGGAAGAAGAARTFPVHIHDIRTEPHIAERARRLFDALNNHTLVEFCAEQSQDPATRPVDVPNWKALQTLFHAGSRDELVELLGFSKSDISAKVTEAVGALGLADLDEPAAGEAPPAEGADDPFAQDPFHPDALAPPAPAPKPVRDAPFRIHPAGREDPDRLVTQALVLGDFEQAVSLLVSKDRFADALVLATRAGDELLVKTQRAFFKRHAERVPYLRVLESIVMENLEDVVVNADLAEWQEIFVLLCTFAKPEDFNALAERLGQRLEDRYLREQSFEDRKNAVLCYLAAGRLEKVTSMWIDEMREEEYAIRTHAHEGRDDSRYSAHAEALQTFMEKVMVFQHAVQYTDEDLQPAADGEPRTYKLAPLYDRVLEYVDVLAEQGLIDVAQRFIALTPADYVPASAVASAAWQQDRLLRAPAGDAAAAPTYDQGYSDYGQGYDAYNQYDSGAYYGGASAPPAAAPSVPQVPQVPQVPTVPQVPPVPTVPQVPTVPSVPTVPQVPSAPPAAPPQQPLAPPPTAAQVAQAQSARAAPPPPPQVPQVPQVPTVPTVPTALETPAAYTPSAAPAYAPPPQPTPSAYAPTNAYSPAPSAYAPAPQASAPPAAPAAASMPPPPPIKRDKGGWNDVPAAASAPPKRAPSAAGHQQPITSPFPNQAGPPSVSAGPPRAGAPGVGAPPRAGSVPPPGVPPSPRTGMGHPAAPGRQGAGGTPYGAPPPGAQGAALLRPTTPGARGVRPPPGARADMPLRAQHTGPSQYGRVPSAGVAPPISPRPGMVPSTPGRARPPQMPPTPRLGTPAGGGFGAPPTPQMAASKPGFVHPRGDRTHIAPRLRPVADALSREVQRLHSINAQPKRILDDADRRVQLLLDLLNNALVDEKVVPPLLQLAQAIQARDQQGALQLHVHIATMASGDLATALVGVKFLIAKLST